MSNSKVDKMDLCNGCNYRALYIYSMVMVNISHYKGGNHGHPFREHKMADCRKDQR